MNASYERVVPVRAGWLVVAFLFSGAAALMLEVVWNRALHLLFGGSALATSAVLAAYMGGLAAGSLLLAPVIRRVLHPALAYGVMELGIAGYALAVPWLLHGVGLLQSQITTAGQESLAGAAVRFFLAVVVLLVPTMLMGATLPCLADLVDAPTPSSGEGRDRAADVGILYSANTLGAVLGTLMATFLLFPLLGVAHTNHLAAALDAVVGTAAIVIWRSVGSPGPLVNTVAVGPAATGLDRPWALPLWIYGLTGAAAMALEVLWVRSLAMVLGSSIHAFTLMLAAFLLGLAVGSSVASSRWMASLRAGPALAVTVAGAGAAAFAGTWLIDALPDLVYHAARSPNLSTPIMWALTLLCAAVVMFPAAIGFGAVLPLALRAASPDGSRAALGDLVGRAYAINTLGAIVGALLAGFVMGPWLGVDHGAKWLCVVLVAAGALLLVRVRSHVWLAGAMAAGALAMVGWDGFDVARWSAGAFRVYLARAVFDDGLPVGNVVFRKDGLSTTVTVEDNDGRICLKVNGKVDASSEGDMSTQVLSGLLPALLHPEPKRAAIVGFGSGITSDALLALPSIQDLEMIELEPAVVEAGEYFAPWNHRPWKDPRYKGIFDDGRHHLARPGAPYDLIISEPSNPWITGASSLFTREFWTLARTRLAPGGIFLQWVQLYELAPERIQSLVGTFSSSFPHVLVFSAHPDSNDTLMLGSNEPLTLDEALLKARWEDPAVRAQLLRADVHSPLDVLALLMADGTSLAPLVQDAVINTDDNLYVELNAPMDLVAYAAKESDVPVLRSLDGKRAALVERNTRFVAGREPPELAAALADVMLRQSYLSDARHYAAQLVGMGQTHEEFRERLLEAAETLEGDGELQVADERVAEEGDQRYLRVVQALVDGNDRKALQMFEVFPELEMEHPSYRLLYAYLLYRNNWRYRARRAFEPLLGETMFLAAHPEALYYGARIYWLVDDNQKAAELALRYVDARRVRRDATPLADMGLKRGSPGTVGGGG